MRLYAVLKSKMSINSSLLFSDLSDFCRVCLQLPEESQYLDLTTIYDEEDSLTYAECFTICTQIDLNAGDDLPHHLCKSCGLELQMTYDFYKKVEESKRLIDQRLEAQKEAATEYLTDSKQCRNQNSNEKSTTVIEKYILTDDEEQLPGTSEETDEDCLMKPKYEQQYLAPTNPTETVNIICDTESGALHQVLAEKNSSNLEALTGNNVTIDVVDHLEMEDYQNLEALEEEDPPPLMSKRKIIESENDNEKGIIANTTITPYIPSGIRLPIPPGPPFICEFCGHSTKNKNLLASHRHRKHRYKEQPYQCEKCDKSFNSKELYYNHLKRLRCQIYPEFTCEYCKKKIVGLANYNIHLRFHEKICPFVCHECGKGFMLAIHMKAHIQTKHENKRYICEETNCGKLFQSKQSLKSHMYIHVGSMPYCCEYCDKMFPSRGRLRWHIKTVHNFEVSSQDLDRMMVAEEITIKTNVKSIIERD